MALQCQTLKKMVTDTPAAILPEYVIVPDLLRYCFIYISESRLTCLNLGSFGKTEDGEDQAILDMNMQCKRLKSYLLPIVQCVCLFCL